MTSNTKALAMIALILCTGHTLTADTKSAIASRNGMTEQEATDLLNEVLAAKLVAEQDMQTI